MSTTLPHGIIQINEGNISWYGDITANWQLIDSKIGIYDAAIASIPAPANNGTLTINYGGTTIAMFGADDAGNVTADIPAPGDGTLTVTQGGSTLGTFSANQAAAETIDIPAPGDGTLTVTQGGSTLGTFSANQAAAETIDIPAPGDGTLTIRVNGTAVQTFTANQSTAATANITVPTATSELTNDSNFVASTDLATVATSGSYNDLSNKPTIPTALESLSTNSIPFHNAYPRCKYLGTSITNAQNTAIKTRTYDDLFIGDYWTINGVNWRIVVIDYYYNVGDTNFGRGNIIVMPDTILYSAQMNTTDTTAGAYAGSLMRTQNLSSARTIAQNAFGSHLANHRIFLANAVDSSGPSASSWYDSDGVELPTEVQIYGTRVWGSALKGCDVGTQKQQFPLMLFAPQFVNIKQGYWLQDVSSRSVSSNFANVFSSGFADSYNASQPYGVRPSVTLSYI